MKLCYVGAKGKLLTVMIVANYQNEQLNLDNGTRQPQFYTSIRLGYKSMMNLILVCM